jgi:DNA-binding transcriptional regulator YiaG
MSTKLVLRSLTTEYPTATEIKNARKQARLTYRESAVLVFVPTQYWKDCESGSKRLHPALAQLFALKSGLITVDETLSPVPHPTKPLDN